MKTTETSTPHRSRHESMLLPSTDLWRLRFEGVNRLYGTGAVDRLAASHVVVVGLGGVGSWTVEALARSGIGSLSLVDLDEVRSVTL